MPTQTWPLLVVKRTMSQNRHSTMSLPPIQLGPSRQMTSSYRWLHYWITTSQMKILSRTSFCWSMFGEISRDMFQVSKTGVKVCQIPFSEIADQLQKAETLESVGLACNGLLLPPFEAAWAEHKWDKGQKKGPTTPNWLANHLNPNNFSQSSVRRTLPSKYDCWSGT